MRSDIILTTRFQITTVALTALLKLLMVDVLHLKYYFILGAGLFWVTYIIWSVLQEPGILTKWGFRTDGFWSTAQWLIVPAILVIACSAWYGVSQGQVVLTWHLIPVLLLYPIWGTLQQFLLISLFGGNLMSLEYIGLSKPVVILLASLLFAIIHYPSFPLVVATFVLAVCYMWLFLRYRNIIALGIFHGWLAAVFYFFALGRDVWAEFLGS